MPSVAIITDTDASLPAGVAAHYGVRQVPIVVHFGAQSFKTGDEIDDVALFARVDGEGRLPTTSAPSPSASRRSYGASTGSC